MAPAMMHRRRFNQLFATATLGAGVANRLEQTIWANATDAPAATRGIVLLPEDLSLTDWPQRAHTAGLTTMALHHQSSPAAIVRFVQSSSGKHFLSQCQHLGLHTEYELHAMKELLPRDLFVDQPDLFRMQDNGQRTPDANLCVHSEQALDIVCRNALRLSDLLKPTTGRYFLWGDDGQPWCRCPKCREYSDSDQALLLENRLLLALQSRHSHAQLAHLAYRLTLLPPLRVRPDRGIFLEYAPIQRRYDTPYRGQTGKEALGALQANLQIFPAATAQILEYWLDVSRFSNWKRPGVKLPFREDVVRADVQTYAALGIHHLTSFAAWIDADYVKRFKDLSFIDQYGSILNSSQRSMAESL